MSLTKIFKRFDRWNQTRRLKATKEKISNNLSDENLRKSTENILLILKDNLDKYFDPKLAFNIRVKTISSDIKQLTKLMIFINHDLVNNQILSAAKCDGQFEEYSLDELFVDNDSLYIEWLQVKSFCEEALKMCEYTEGYEEYDHGMEEHNLRMLSKVFITVRSVGSGLLDVLLA